MSGVATRERIKIESETFAREPLDQMALGM